MPLHVEVRASLAGLVSPGRHLRPAALLCWTRASGPPGQRRPAQRDFQNRSGGARTCGGAVSLGRRSPSSISRLPLFSTNRASSVVPHDGGSMNCARLTDVAILAFEPLQAGTAGRSGRTGALAQRLSKRGLAASLIARSTRLSDAASPLDALLPFADASQVLSVGIGDPGFDLSFHFWAICL